MKLFEDNYKWALMKSKDIAWKKAPHYLFEDVVAELMIVYLELTRIYNEDASGLSFRSWAIVTMKRRVVDVLRKEFGRGGKKIQRHAVPLEVEINGVTILDDRSTEDRTFGDVDMRLYLEDIFERHRDQQIAKMRLVEGKSLKETGKCLGISESRVCQVWKDLVETLRSRHGS